MGRHPVEVVVWQGPPVSLIVFVIYISGHIKWVKESICVEELWSVEDLGSVATESNANQVITILERCAAKSIMWANTQGPKFNTAKMDPALFSR